MSQFENEDKVGHRKRIKEKVLNNIDNMSSFYDYEILEAILFSAVPRKDVKPISKTMLHKFGSIRKILSSSHYELKTVDGVGNSIIILIKLINELINRYFYETIASKPVLGNLTKLIQYVCKKIGDISIECTRIIYLNCKYVIIFDEAHNIGTINNTSVYIREVIQKSLDIGAYYIVLTHNHPSGDPMPSEEDLLITKKLSDACSVVNIYLLDHIIVSNKKHFSFRESGLLK